MKRNTIFSLETIDSCQMVPQRILYVFDFNYSTSLFSAGKFALHNIFSSYFDYSTVFKTVRIYYEYRSTSVGDSVYIRRTMYDHDLSSVHMWHIIRDYQIDLISFRYVSKFSRFICFPLVSKFEACSGGHHNIYCIFSSFPILCRSTQTIARHYFRGKIDKLPKI